MEKLVELIVSTLGPAIESIKTAAPEIIRREAGWILWSNMLGVWIGSVMIFLAAALITIGAIISCEHDFAGPAMVATGIVFAIIGVIVVLCCAIELRHMAINPTYMLIKHFMGD